MTSRHILSAIAFSAAFGLVGAAQTAPTAQLASPQDPGAAARAAQCFASGDVRTAHAPSGVLRFVGAEPGRPIAHPDALGAAGSPEAAARAYLGACGSFFGLQPTSIVPGAQEPIQQLAMRSSIPGESARTTVRFQQTHRNIPVMGGELIVNLDASNNILSVGGETLTDASIDTTPVVDATTAVATARAVVAKTYGIDGAALIVTPPEPWIYDPALIGPGGGIPALVWRMDVTPSTLRPIRELVLVDARRGSVPLHFNQVETAKNRETYTASNTTTLPGTLVCGESNPTCSGGDAHAVGAHTYAGDTYDFFLNTLGRDSINNAGMTMKSTVHYDSGYDNAFWSSTLNQMVYGDASGFALADDVVAHELTHGVTNYTSNLFYYYQSGAVNESLSDVFGEFVDLTNGRGTDTVGVRWLVGEDVTGLGAIRNMQNPPAFSDPDKMTSSFYTRSASDNGGVHSNSGVNNKAAFLMVDGGTFNGQTVTALGIPKVAKIYYEVETRLLTSGADYADLANALLQACFNLIGTAGISAADCQEVRDATVATEMTLQPSGGPFNTDAAMCPVGQVPAHLFLDNLEAGGSNFVTITPTGTNRWSYDSPYGPFAHSGTHFLYADDDPGEVADTSVAMNSSVTLPANAFLHFAHAYGFEGGSFDGGVVEYSTNGGGSWVDAASLFDTNGYGGTIASGYSNPLSGRPAFVNDSHGYISSRLNLASLAGQNIRFRWRMGLDISGLNWGWWVDDVRVYTCRASGGIVTDADGDRKADLAVFRPSDGMWHIRNSGTGFATNTSRQFGLPGDVPVPRDFDGDGVMDIAVYRPDTGAWHVLRSSTGFTSIKTFALDAREDPKSVTFGLGTRTDLPAPGDFDGDGVTDPATFRPSTGLWSMILSSHFTTVSTHPWGRSGDVPVPGNYDNDNKSDLAVYRPSNGTWYILTSTSSQLASLEFQWGLPGDIPVPGDYDGDGRTDVAVYRPTTGQWFIRQSSTNFATSVFYQWGLAGDVPVPSEFDGDGKTDLAVYRPSNGTWYIAQSTTAYATSVSYQWGLSSDLPAPNAPIAYALAKRATLATLVRASDFDRDRRSDLTVFRPSNGTWFSLRSAEGFSLSTSTSWGLIGDVPMPYDYDGDGQTDFTVYRPSTGFWWSLLSSTGFTTSTSRQWGIAGDLPVSGDFDGDGLGDPTVYRPSSGMWYILQSKTNYTTSLEFQWGLSGDIPLSGDFDGDAVTDITVYRPSTGEWYTRYSTTDFAVTGSRQWGLAGDVSVPGEYDGDGRTDHAVYRPSTGTWFILRSSTNHTEFSQYQWGLSEDTPVPGDFDGDGRTDLAVWRPSTGVWYLLRSSSNFTTFDAVQWGLSGDIPILKRP